MIEYRELFIHQAPMKGGVLDNVPSAPAQNPPSIVEARGAYGSVAWTVCKELTDILPSGEREQILRVTGNQVVGPFFVKTTDRVLAIVGCKDPASKLDCSWSLESIDVECTFGQVIWSVGQGLWDAIPEDRRDNIIEMVKDLIHETFHIKVLNPLYGYAQRQLRG